MSEVSDLSNLYDGDINANSEQDFSSQMLQTVPKIEDKFLSVLCLQNNNIRALPDDFFQSLPYLMWLDLRDNLLSDIPNSIQDHQYLTHLLLQNNNINALPNELGTVASLKVLQLNGNPLVYPENEIITGGINKILKFLHSKFMENYVCQSDVLSEDTASTYDKLNISDAGQSYNSVIEQIKNRENRHCGELCVQFNEKEIENCQEIKSRNCKKKCPRFARSRLGMRPFSQSSKYLRSVHLDQVSQMAMIEESFSKEIAQKRKQTLLNAREKELQCRKNLQVLLDWRKSYRNHRNSKSNNTPHVMDPSKIPYDVNPEYLTLLSREDIEKELPNKYKKRLIRKCKPSVPRKNASDAQLAMKIKQLFENLSAINLDCTDMTPRTEQKVLMNEIEKISDIKQKLTALTLENSASAPI